MKPPGTTQCAIIIFVEDSDIYEELSTNIKPFNPHKNPVNRL